MALRLVLAHRLRKCCWQCARPISASLVTGLRDLHALKIPATVAGITACGIVDGMPLAIATQDDSLLW